MYFSQNIKLLRKRRNRTQDVVSGELGFSRSTLNSYENGIVINPTLEALVSFSKYFRVSIDTMIKVNLAQLSESQLSEIEKGYDVYMTGGKLRVLATTIDSLNRENIEVVPLKAKAGYTAGYNDPQYISALPTFQLPFLSSERKYRAFQIDGDSMLPIQHGSWIIAEFVQDWRDVKDGSAYIVVTKDEGIVFKIVYNQTRKQKNFLLRSLNTSYEPFEVPVNEVIEIWKFINFISSELPEPESTQEQLSKMVMQLQSDISEIKASAGGKKR
ncbi:MAG: LexA family transcriptional regulator [Bacteroidia bacterium]|jgi:transcriptional regulator with XRE-family HTH domain|nr:LexA family transcriptional regulator [Bacteroidota bacterium]MBL7915930.1 LexA family transcriptional regulator [Bacteroidia bacterium]MBK7390342.1 LexA family transcriptional regulator [Bacteroidota bacterium]MBK8875627.1 LexA family transcriptional regulator [Bacteroidota bacterium]MBK9046583.1 LexA family transcriptional regulator [Bacteroidota bacterium]